MVRYVALALAVASSSTAVAAEKPEKIPVAFGAWTGKGASAFKSALGSGLRKDCKIVPKKSARVTVEGTVTEEGKGAVVRVIVKQAKSGEVVEQRDFKFPRPKPSGGGMAKMSKAVTEIARRAPTE